MSFVTNVILTIYGPVRNEKFHQLVEEINTNCFDVDKTGFKAIDITNSPELYGGSKIMNGIILMGGFNYCDVDKLIKGLNEIEWEEIALCVNLFYHIEDDEHGYKSVTIYNNYKTGENRIMC